MIQQTREVRGIPLWLVKAYLIEIGGAELELNVVQGQGWKVQIQQMADFQVGSIRVGQVRLDLEAEPEIYPALTAALDMKFLRAGG